MVKTFDANLLSPSLSRLSSLTFSLSSPFSHLLSRLSLTFSLSSLSLHLPDVEASQEALDVVATGAFANSLAGSRNQQGQLPTDT